MSEKKDDKFVDKDLTDELDELDEMDDLPEKKQAKKDSKTAKANKSGKTDKADSKKKKKEGKGKKVVKWMRDAKSEFKKIIWPTRQTVIRNTVVTIAMCAVVGVFVALFDWGLSELVKLLTK